MCQLVSDYRDQLPRDPVQHSALFSSITQQRSAERAIRPEPKGIVQEATQKIRFKPKAVVAEAEEKVLFEPRFIVLEEVRYSDLMFLSSDDKQK